MAKLMSRRLVPMALVVLAATLAALAVWQTADRTSPSQAVGEVSPQSQTVAALDFGGPAIVDGVVQLPLPVRREAEALERRLETCMNVNGAKKIPVDIHGFTFDDPNGSASKACSGVLNALDAFQKSPAFRAADSATEPIARSLAACIDQEIGRRGLGGAPNHATNPDVSVDAWRAALQTIEQGCTSTTNSAVLAGQIR